ncbi:hypothetical protein Anas_06871 [Armadillidium nasatum]|uniref:Uncharacterized protein n=1 Tax=Armadillidium nasatum TaxID=96803 RepID=A0A5N5T3E2_9CRUS|nr:hypothetical protein Anas_06871 [Armadillidium nasatum]
MSRDLDSEVLRREYDAVSEWLNSTTKSLHIMRDHPHHRHQILGGIWGMRLRDGSREKIRRIRDQMYEEAFDDVRTVVDQKLLMLLGAGALDIKRSGAKRMDILSFGVFQRSGIEMVHGNYSETKLRSIHE